MPDPGWYPNPDGTPSERWWDGTAWTDSTRPVPAPPPWDPSTPLPGYVPPGYGGPNYVPPGYGAPGYGAPGYGVPGYGQPARQATALLVVGYILAAISLLFCPILFGPGGVLCGYFALRQGDRRGKTLMIVAAVATVAGMVIGGLVFAARG